MKEQAIQVPDGLALNTDIWKKLGQGNTKNFQNKDEMHLIS